MSCYKQGQLSLKCSLRREWNKHSLETVQFDRRLSGIRVCLKKTMGIDFVAVSSQIDEGVLR